MKNQISGAHGSPYDRGSMDSYYRRGRHPHYGVPTQKRVDEKDMTPEEIEEYMLGFDNNEEFGDHKVWD